MSVASDSSVTSVGHLVSWSWFSVALKGVICMGQLTSREVLNSACSIK